MMARHRKIRPSSLIFKMFQPNQHQCVDHPLCHQQIIFYSSVSFLPQKGNFAYDGGIEMEYGPFDDGEDDEYTGVGCVEIS